MWAEGFTAQQRPGHDQISRINPEYVQSKGPALGRCELAGPYPVEDRCQCGVCALLNRKPLHIQAKALVSNYVYRCRVV